MHGRGNELQPSPGCRLPPALGFCISLPSFSLCFSFSFILGHRSLPGGLYVAEWSPGEAWKSTQKNKRQRRHGGHGLTSRDFISLKSYSNAPNSKKQNIKAVSSFPKNLWKPTPPGQKFPKCHLPYLVCFFFISKTQGCLKNKTNQKKKNNQKKKKKKKKTWEPDA